MPPWLSRWPWPSGAALLGIDLESPQACLLSCARAGPSWRIEQCAGLDLPPESLQAGRILEFELLAASLKQLVEAAGGGRRIALALPHSAAWHQTVAVPVGLRPWAWRGWVRRQAEQLAGVSADTLAIEVTLQSGSPLCAQLSVCPRELVEDWQGLAEAADLDLVLLDDRSRVVRLAQQALGWVPGSPAANQDPRDLVVWRPGLDRPAQTAGFLAALGLALRAWHP